MDRTIRILAAVATLAALGLVSLVVVLSRGESAPSTIEVGPAKRLGGPLLRQPTGLMLASRAADVLIGLAVRPGRFEAITVPSGGKPIRGQELRVFVDGAPIAPSPCGENCFTAKAPVLRGRALLVKVKIRRAGKPTAQATLRLPGLPPPGAPSIYRAAKKRMSALRSVRVDERLSSGGERVVKARFLFRAPNRMEYVVSGGGRAVVIGKRRWDRDRNRWSMSLTEPTRFPAFIWRGASRPRLIGRAVIGQKPVDVLAAFRLDRSYPAWFRLYVRPDHTVLKAEMFAPAHFMVDRFSLLDAPISIKPPK